MTLIAFPTSLLAPSSTSWPSNVDSTGAAPGALGGAPLVSPQPVARSGLTPTYNAASALVWFVPGSSTFVHIKNGGASSIVVTVLTHSRWNDINIQNLQITVPAGGERMVGPLPEGVFADHDNLDAAAVLFSDTTSVTVACLSVR